MRKLLTLLLFLPLCFPVYGQRKGKNTGNDYQFAWQALDKNDFRDARSLLKKAATQPRYHDDAIATLLLLDNYSITDDKAISRYHNPLRRMSNPAPYFYTFWFNGPALGAYGKMDSAHLSNADFILSDDLHFNGSLQAAALYFKALNDAIRGHADSARADNARIGAISHWAFTGPFDNTAGSGFDKHFAPISHPQMDTTFKAFNNTPVKWFIPAHVQNDNWIMCNEIFPQTAGLLYAQSFVHADRDLSCLLCLGSGGSLKVWVNDRLVFARSEEKNTELDTYKVPCDLHQGYNRVLVQVGFADIALPNFIVRFTDRDYRPVAGLTSTAHYHPYQVDASGDMPTPIPLFAETFFQEKISKEPSNPVNYLLLADTYLRNQKYYQAQKLLTGLVSLHPDNALVLSVYMASVQSTSNTDALECLEKIKKLDPQGALSLVYKESELENNKKYKEAVAVLDTLEQLIGPHSELLIKKVQAIASREDVEKMVALIRQGYELYPDNTALTLMMYNYYKKVSHNPSKALQVLQEFCGRLSVSHVAMQLALEYIDEGQFTKGMDILRRVKRQEPWSAGIYNTIATEYYKQNTQDSAIVWLKKLSANEPYRSRPYSDMGTCYSGKGDTADAIRSFQRALDCDPSLSGVRKKMRDLEKAPELTSYFPKVSEDSLIAANLSRPFDTTHHYYYIFKIHNTLVYAQGSNEQEQRTAVYINDAKGVDNFNTVYIPYNNNYQQLTILKAQVDKADGSQVPATINDNRIVFPKIAPGDVVFYDFKLSSSGIGRMGREFWDSFYFLGSIPTCLAEYNLLIGSETPLYYTCTHDTTLRPRTSDHGKYRLYTWSMKDIDALKEEPLMPPSVDIGQVLHLSTIPSWSVIADWYSDVTREQSEKSLNLDQLMRKLFPEGTKGLTAMQKAKTIYDYVVPNIAYNAVSFMHSAFVPQKASKTLSSKLGDCKDMSTLFVALARQAGLKANLVLVSTRDNGQHAMELPSMEFNHCIVRFTEGSQQYYLELTDKNLPFMALPSQLYGAQVLNIPYDDDSSAADLFLLKPRTKLPDLLHRKLTLTVSGSDLTGKSVLTIAGAQTSAYRDRFRHESESDIDKSMQEVLTGSFKKPVEVEDVKWNGLDGLCDTVRGQVNFVVKNEIIQLGDMNIWKPDFIDLVATSNLFTVKERKYPLEYWEYENTQQYETELEIDLPQGDSLRQIPSDVTLDFGYMKYRLCYKKLSPGKLLIERSFVTQPWRNIQVSEYPGLEDFFNKIIKAESRYISF